MSAPGWTLHPDPTAYWEDRARRYAGRGRGLAAVCSYGMPAFHNAAIDLAQRRALARWLAVSPGTRVLDIGCGVGRWSRRLARRGARVTGVDWSPTMLAEARRRARAEGVEERCAFAAGDVRHLDLGESFDLVLGVTVLQHLVGAGEVEQAVRALRRHLSRAGRLVLLEAAPSRSTSRLDSPVFRARPASFYLEAFARSGLALESLGGVDPAPFRRLLLAHHRRWPRPLAWLALLAATAAGTVFDTVAGHRLVGASWHKVFVLRPVPLPGDRG